ncbi:MAG TPA: hypothetical protein VJN43_11130 [Bryobacteraceae bacterium]|nr:hypothetical protein [Bryobacteraceae bacterium]
MKAPVVRVFEGNNCTPPSSLQFRCEAVHRMKFVGFFRNRGLFLRSYYLVKPSVRTASATPIMEAKSPIRFLTPHTESLALETELHT